MNAPTQSESLATVKPSELANVPPGGVDLPRLFEMALTNKVDVTVIERLMDLNERMLARQAEEDFNKAMAEFQAECPIIDKPRAVAGKNGQTMYHFAPLDYILVQTRELRDRHGFTHSFDSKTDKGSVKATCIVTHRGGHKRTSEFEIPAIAASSAMNAAQAHASALSYAKRYAFLGAYGIQTGEDDDANSVREDKSKLGEFRRQREMRAQQEAQRGPIVNTAREEGDEPRGPVETHVPETIDAELQDFLTMLADAKDGEDLKQLLIDAKAMDAGPKKEAAQAAFVARRDALGYRWDGKSSSFVK